jgi:hypothetical protein
MNFDAALKQTAEAFLEQHEVTNPDRVTFENHVKALVDQLSQACDEYLDAAKADAEPNPREKGDDDGVEYADPRDHMDGIE